MVVILACLSLILTAGGGAMALYGADLIRSESGLALTQSGITMLSAGLVLAGLTTAVVELRRMRRLMELEDPLVHPAAPPAPPSARVSEVPVLPAAPVPAPAPAVPEVAVVARPAVADSAPVPPLPPPPLAEKRQPAGSGIPAEAKASLVGIAAGRAARKGGEEAASAAAASAPEKDVGTAGETASEQGGKAAPEPDAAVTAGADSSPASETIARDAPAPETTGERKMLATYNSGGITYFMFSDGSIEADMAGGRFRFTSMDELRGYIDTGKGGVLVEPATPVGATG